MVEILAFWDRTSRLWIVTCHDAEGHQLWDADFYPNRRTLAVAWQNGGRTQFRKEPQ